MLTEEEFKCSKCGGFFVEEHTEDSPAFVVPQIADNEERGEVLGENGQPIGVQQEIDQQRDDHQRQN